MTTLYALLIDRCGLSQREAAELHGVRIDTVKSWSSGRNRAPKGVIDELRDLYAKIDRSAKEALERIHRLRPDIIEIGYCADDAEAQTLGWPCCGAHDAMIGIIAAKCGKDIILVSRGSTTDPATATATATERVRR